VTVIIKPDRLRPSAVRRGVRLESMTGRTSLSEAGFDRHLYRPKVRLLKSFGGYLDPAIRGHLKSGQRSERAEVIAASLSTLRNVGL
jgi:hypothetical protein